MNKQSRTDGVGGEGATDPGVEGGAGTEVLEDAGTGAGGDDGAQDASGEAAADGESGAGDGSGADGGAEGGEAGEGGEEGEGDAGGEAEAPTALTAEQVDAILEKRLAEREAARKDQGAASARELTEEEWQKKEEEWGGVSRQAIQSVANMHVQLLNLVMAKMDERLSKFERQDALTSLSKEQGFSDAVSLRPGIEEFMKDFPVNMHSNPGLLKKAVIYARGLGANGRLAAARSAGEKNRKIVGAGRPAAPSSSARRPVGGPLNLTQRAAAALHPGGEAGYRKDLASRGKPLS